MRKSYLYSYISLLLYSETHINLHFLKVDGDTSTNDAVIALASGLSGSNKISSLDSTDAKDLQACLDAVC